MHRIVLPITLLFVLVSLPGMAVAGLNVDVQAPRDVTIPEGGVGRSRVMVTIPDGYHVQVDDQAAVGKMFTTDKASGIELVSVAAPLAADLADQKELRGKGAFILRFRYMSGKAPGSERAFKLTARIPLCLDKGGQCLMPVPVTVDAKAIFGPARRMVLPGMQGWITDPAAAKRVLRGGWSWSEKVFGGGQRDVRIAFRLPRRGAEGEQNFVRRELKAGGVVRGEFDVEKRGVNLVLVLKFKDARGVAWVEEYRLRVYENDTAMLMLNRASMNGKEATTVHGEAFLSHR